MKTSAQSQLSLSPSRRLAIALWCLIGSFVTLVSGGAICSTYGLVFAHRVLAAEPKHRS